MEAHGNFRDYYRFNPASERVLPLLSSRSLRALLSACVSESRGLAIVDMGCNVGDVAVELYDGVRAKMEEIAKGGRGEDGGEGKVVSCEGEGRGTYEAGNKRKRSVCDRDEKQKEKEKETEKEEDQQSNSSPEQSPALPRLSILGVDLDRSLIERAKSNVLSLSLSSAFPTPC